MLHVPIPCSRVALPISLCIGGGGGGGFIADRHHAGSWVGFFADVAVGFFASFRGLNRSFLKSIQLKTIQKVTSIGCQSHSQICSKGSMIPFEKTESWFSS